MRTGIRSWCNLLITPKVSPLTSGTSWQSLPSKSKHICAAAKYEAGMSESFFLTSVSLIWTRISKRWQIRFQTGLLLMGQTFCGPSGYIHSKTPLGINYGIVASSSATCLNAHASRTSTNQQTRGCEHAHNTHSSPDCTSAICEWTLGSSVGLPCQWKFKVSLGIRKQEGNADCSLYCLR